MTSCFDRMIYLLITVFLLSCGKTQNRIDSGARPKKLPFSSIASNYLDALSSEGLKAAQVDGVEKALHHVEETLSQESKDAPEIALPAYVEATISAMAENAKPSTELSLNATSPAEFENKSGAFSLGGSSKPSLPQVINIAKITFAAAFTTSLKIPEAKNKPAAINENLGKVVVKSSLSLNVSAQNLGSVAQVVVAQQTRVLQEKSGSSQNSTTSASQTLSGMLSEVTNIDNGAENKNIAVQGIVQGSVTGQLEQLKTADSKTQSWATLTATAVAHISATSLPADSKSLTDSVMKGSVGAATQAQIKPESAENAKMLAQKVNEKIEPLHYSESKLKEVASNTFNSFLKEIVSVVKTVVRIVEDVIRDCFNLLAPRNHPPVLAPQPDVAIVANKESRIVLEATDEDHDKLTFSCVVQSSSVCPTGLGFVNNVLLWTPTLAQTGTFLVNVRVSDGLAKNETSFRISVGAPAYGVSSVLPTSGPLSGGHFLTITGLGFSSSANIVSLGESDCGSVKVLSNTQLQCLVPPLPAGKYSAVISNAVGQQATLSTAYEAVAAPELSALAPTDGPLAGGQTVLIQGSHFKSGMTIDFGNAPCTNVQIVNEAATEASCVTPQAVPGPVVLTATNPDSQKATGLGYTYNAVPQITAVLPNQGPVTGGTSVTLAGNGFLPLPTVSIGGVACSIIFVSNTSIQCTTRATAFSGTVEVRLTNHDGQSADLPRAFEYLPGPTLSAILPNNGRLSGGQMLTIQGQHFLPGARAFIENSPCTQPTIQDSQTLTCITPELTAGEKDVTFVNGDGQSISLTGGFTANPWPVMSAITPRNGRLSGGFQMVISGSNFLPGAQVLVGDLICQSPLINSNGTQLTCTVPAHGAGTFDVSVTNLDTQNAIYPMGFSYNIPPVLESVSPSNGALAGGTTLQLSGSHFRAGASVMVGLSQCFNVRVSSDGSSALCETPVSTLAGDVDLILTNQDTQSTTLAAAYRYNPLPTLESVSPSWGDAEQNTAITLHGSHFMPGALVALSGTPCANAVVVNDSMLTCLALSAVNAGSRSITVVNPDNQQANLISGFTYHNLELGCDKSSATGLAGRNLELNCTATTTTQSAIQWEISGCNDGLHIDSEGKVTGRMPLYSCLATIKARDILLSRTQDFHVVTTRPLFQTNGPVTSMIPFSDGGILVGGDFTAVNPDPAPALLKVTTAGGIDSKFNPGLGFNGAVYASLILSDNSILVGGDFTSYNGSPANRIAHLSSTGELDLVFNPPTGENGTNGPVFALALSGGDFYVGGRFTKMRGVVVNNIAKIQSDGSVNLVFSPPSSQNNGTNLSVYTLAVSGSDLFMGGAFTTYRGANAQYVAKMNSDGVLNTVFSQSQTNGTSGNVNALMVDGNALYIGGAFDKYRGGRAFNIAKVAVVDGALDTVFSPASGANGTDSSVKSLALFRAEIVIGGTFSSYRNDLRSGYVVVNSAGVVDSTYSVRSFAALTKDAYNASVLSIGVQGNELTLAGSANDFFNYHTWGAMARITPASFPNSDSTYAASATASYTGPVYSLAVTSSGIFVGGQFASLRNGERAEGLAKFLPDGTLDPDFHDPSLPLFQNSTGNSRVLALLLKDNSIYVGGTFTRYRNSKVNGLAKIALNGDLDLTFSPDEATASGVSVSGLTFGERGVYALAADQNYLYIGGHFDRYRGTQIAKHIARVTLQEGILDTVFSPQTGNNGMSHYNTTVVRSLVLSNGSLYAGGDFVAFKNGLANFIAKISPEGVLDTAFNPPLAPNGMNSGVTSLVASGSSLFAGGAFSQYRGRVVRSLVKLGPDGTADTAFSPAATGPGYFETGLSSSVATLSLIQSQLYIGGFVTDFKGTVVRNLAKISLSGTLDVAFSTSLNTLSGTNGVVRAIADCGRLGICVGGDFIAAGNESASSFSIFDAVSGKNALDSAP